MKSRIALDRLQITIWCASLLLLTAAGCRSSFDRRDLTEAPEAMSNQPAETGLDEIQREAPISDVVAPQAAQEAPPSAAAPEAVDANPNGGGAKVKPGLTVQVQVLVLGKKEIDEQGKRVSDDGTLVLPMVGAVKAEGLTLGQLAAELKKRYAEYFRNPQVVVDYVMERGTDAASPWGYVTVLGRVKNPGRVNIPPTRDLTVSAAIQQAGGLETSAKDSGIRVSRQGEDGISETLDVDLRSVGTRGAGGNDLRLKPGDVVFVPEMIF